ncbi:hypothetical protein ABZ907_15640 [Nonomuraea wenchangensis]
MAKSTSSGCLTLIVIGLLAAGCMQIFGISPSDEDEANTAQMRKPSPSPSAVRVPHWKGKRVRDSTLEALEDKGIKVSMTDITGSDSPGCEYDEECVVLSSVPKPGKLIKPGSDLIVKVIDLAQYRFYGKRPTMPNLVGKSDNFDDAIPGLKQLEVISDFVASDYEERPGMSVLVRRVIRQKPAPGTRLRIGQRITLTYATGARSGGGSPDGDLPNADWPNLCRHSRWC